MTRLSLVRRHGSVTFFLAAITLMAFWTHPVSGQTYHNIPGTACAAYNNNQANLLQRSHVRIYNPPTNAQSIWVICPVQRVFSDIDSTSDAPWGYVNAYFSSEASANAEVSCIIREFRSSTTHEPGNSLDGIVNLETISAQKFFAAADVDNMGYALTNEFSNFWYDYFTFTYKLAPGTGINSIDIHQR